MVFLVYREGMQLPLVAMVLREASALMRISSIYMPHCMLQPLFWPLALLQNPLWSRYLATLLAHHPTPVLLCLLLPLPQPIPSGRPWTISMSPYSSALFPSLSMRLLSSISFLLPPPSAPVPWPSPPACPMLGTGSTWCRQPPWASTFRTESFGAACSTGLGSLSSATRSHALNAVELLTSSVTIRLGVVAMVTASLATTPSETWSSPLPSLLPWPPPRRHLVWCPALCHVLLTFFSPTGAVVALPPWMSTSSALSSSSFLGRLRSPQATPYKLVLVASWPLTSQPAVPLGQTSSPWWLRPWAVWPRTPSGLSDQLAMPLLTDLAPLTPPPHPDTSTAGLPLHCGVATLVCGCTAIQLSPPTWTV